MARIIAIPPTWTFPPFNSVAFVRQSKSRQRASVADIQRRAPWVAGWARSGRKFALVERSHPSPSRKIATEPCAGGQSALNLWHATAGSQNRGFSGHEGERHAPIQALPPFAVALVAFGVAGTAAQAQDYPAKPVKWVVAYPPGGTTDILARIIGQYLVRASRPAVRDRQPARRRQQHRHRGGGEFGRPTATRCSWSIRRTASTRRSTRSCRSTSCATSRRSPASPGCRM